MIVELIDFPLEERFAMKRSSFSDEILDALGLLGNSIDWSAATVVTMARMK
jgi:hypothetical protein